MANGTITEQAVWLEPLFFDSQKPQAAPQAAPASDSLAEAVRRLRSGSRAPSPEEQIASFLLHMHRRGHRLYLTQGVIAAAWQICVPAVSPIAIMASARGRNIAGFEKLPPCWQLGLLRWCKSHSKEASLIQSVAVESGVLWPRLTEPVASSPSYCRMVAEELNCAVYPSIYRALRPREVAFLRIYRPDLANDLSPAEP
jgi:hypothetical protein